MKKTLATTVLVLSLAAVPAFAKGKPAGRGNDKPDKSHKQEFKEKDKDKDKDKGHKEKHWDDRRKHDSDHGRTANNGRPPGWDKGKKTGWGNCDVPPGQAKKEGCRSTKTSRPVHVSQPRRRTYPPRRRNTATTTTTTTTTTSATNPPKQGGHPFEPVLRQRQEGGKDQRTIKQSVK
jgi:Ni/Co efflux regulator RcnB